MTRSILSAMGVQPTAFVTHFIASCQDLTSLKGAPISVYGNFDAACNVITSLDGIPSFIDGHAYMFNNKIASLHNIHKQIKHLNGYFNAKSNPITSHVLGLLLIDGLKGVWMDHLQVETILNDHIQGDRDIFACQEELIEAGLEDFAKL